MVSYKAPKVKVPKQHVFSGKKDGKGLDNFLWHIERCFEVISLTKEATEVHNPLPH